MSEILSPEKVAAFKSIADQYHIGALQEMCEGYEELRAQLERLKDDPELDATDFAHPAWWRGEKHGHFAAVRRLQEVLDGKDDGAGAMEEEIEKARRDILALRNAREECEEYNVYDQYERDRLIKCLEQAQSQATVLYETLISCGNGEEAKK